MITIGYGIFIVPFRQYELAVDKLWSLPHREEKYAGIFVARHYAKPKEYDPVSLLLLYERMVSETYGRLDQLQTKA